MVKKSYSRTGRLCRVAMSHKGKTQLTILFTATPDLVTEGDRIFASPAAWMAETHYGEGELALLSYNIVKGLELWNPLDPSSEPTGNTSFVLAEVYESPAGLEDPLEAGGRELGGLRRSREVGG